MEIFTPPKRNSFLFHRKKKARYLVGFSYIYKKIMLRNFISIVLGTGIGMVIMMLMHYFSMLFYPLPEGVSISDAEKFNQYLETAPTGAFVLALISHIIGAFTSSILSVKIACSKEWVSKKVSLSIPIIIGCIFTISGYLNLNEIPHPDWFVVDLLFYFPAAYFGYKLVKRKD